MTSALFFSSSLGVASLPRGMTHRRCSPIVRAAAVHTHHGQEQQQQQQQGLQSPATAAVPLSSSSSSSSSSLSSSPSRRSAVASIALAPLAAVLAQQASFPPVSRADTECTECSNSNSSLQPGDVPFKQSSTGVRYADLREGTGASPEPGQTVVVEWVGYTEGYQAKKIESTRETDAPFTFVVGRGEAIPAFEEAVLEMKQGGIRRIEIPGELEEKLAYSRDPSLRYNVGPVPTTFGGRRALDFVLDNKTLKDFNRTLLFDIRLSNIRK